MRSLPLLIVLLLFSVQTELYSEVTRSTVKLPLTIPADESRDVTSDINEFLATLPDESLIEFPSKGRYRIDGTVLIENKTRLVIEGNGACFRAIDRGEEHAKKENYDGWKATRTRAHFRLKNCTEIVVRNLEIHGAHPNPGRKGVYDANREAQHGIDVGGCQNALIEKVTIHDVYGDCVYLTKNQGVVIRDSKLTRCGRQGIAIATGEDVLIENNEIADSRRGIIDIEPYGKEWKTGNIRIIGNRLGGSRLLLLPQGGSGTIGTIFIADNTNIAHNGTPAISNIGKPDQHRGPLIMVNNEFTIGGSPTQGLRVRHNDGLFIAGNKFLFPAKRKMTALDLEGSRGVVVGNRFLDAISIMDTIESDLTEVENMTADETSFPQTKWTKIEGGFAVRATDANNEWIALMRGGPRLETPPTRIRGYGVQTAHEFAWFHLRNGKVVSSGVRRDSTR